MTEVVHIAIEEPHHLGPVWIATLDDARPEIETLTSGSRTYLAGTVTAAGSDAEDVGRSLLGLAEHLTVWVEYRGSYIRVQSVELDERGDCRLRIRCSQAAHRLGLAFLDGHETALRVVEPSPPRPTDEWFPAERARAIRDLVGDARPAVQVPTPDGKRRVAFDPWAPEFMAEPACPLTKLPASMCAHCRGKDLPARLQEASASGGQTIIGLPWSRPPLSMNDNGATRGARFARARKIADIRRDMVTLARKAGLPKGVRYATITLHYRPRDNTPRDTVNLAPTVKALVDGLTPQKVVPTKRGFNVHAGYGFVPDDSTRHVSTPESVIHRAERGKPGAMWLELTWQG